MYSFSPGLRLPPPQPEVATHPEADAGPLPTPVPAATPAPIAVQASEKAPAQLSSALLSSAQLSSAQLSSAQTPLQNVFDAANKVLEPGGQHIESLGSDALERWVQENAVEKINDNYY